MVSFVSKGRLKPKWVSSFVLAVPSSSNMTFKKPHVSLSSSDLPRHTVYTKILIILVLFKFRGAANQTVFCN
ncbi:hypothetical protein RHMOL_Rhmol01G0132600 [Rhododendron molle]|uniref:Uncharacterized protein n=1 Tax=Rhododendron molle TaxID=49168 RepID=A0ACC0Q1K1_RHOML|nr:hypothetical protein RHMOL_Rhmol01G0132600 [Rhododendron molle]